MLDKIKKIPLVFHTVKYLKPIQIYYQIYYRVRSMIGITPGFKGKEEQFLDLEWRDVVYNPTTLKGENTFEFLNLKKAFIPVIDWNEDSFGKLWTYNLNYFEYLNQENISSEQGQRLIQNFIEDYHLVKDGKEPYPTSLRIMNLMKFIGKNQLNDPSYFKLLKEDADRLMGTLEYHLLGNHLLENGFALWFVSHIFKDQKYYDKAIEILKSELDEQILNDGAHFELSPMYHILILYRLLDAVSLARTNDRARPKEDLAYLVETAERMLGWLYNVTYKNGTVPMVNDASPGITISSNEIFVYANALAIEKRCFPFSDSGYRKVATENFELFFDVGNIGPSYQPGHAHSDTLSFEFHHQKKPIIVDTGISTYDKNETRQKERSTGAHNTVVINNAEQSQVWGGFRVAKRASIIDLKEEECSITATHDGYRENGMNHTRSFSWNSDEVYIRDSISKPTEGNAKAIFHFDEHIEVEVHNMTARVGNIKIEFQGANAINLQNYQLAKGFNKTVEALKLVVGFDQILTTKVSL
ncbi:Heparin-sulfate lyase [Tenacibaculum litopenaei]|uniref:heparinase II/III domain-containing protein n=1 Tax=Tenacibaculum litopenaei TaxID=396016 RepID=UPI003894E512